MNAKKAPALEAGVSSLAPDSGGIELPERDDAVLAPGNPGDQGIRLGVADFCLHVHA